jgi:hypothetical protein
MKKSTSKTSVRRRGVFAAILLCCLLAGFAACELQSPEQLLVGKWQASVGVLEFNAFEFKADHTVSLGLTGNLIQGAYTVTTGSGDTPNRLTITYTFLMISHTANYTFTVTSTDLYVTKEGSSIALHYTREPQAVTTTTAA